MAHSLQALRTGIRSGLSTTLTHRIRQMHSLEQDAGLFGPRPECIDQDRQRLASSGMVEAAKL